jgi:hypothetical protein
MIAYNDEFKLRRVCEEILSHEPGGDGVTAGHVFDLSFSPRPSFFSFTSGDEARTYEHRLISGVTVSPSRYEGRHWGGARVVAKHTRYGVEKRGFPVLSRADCSE